MLMQIKVCIICLKFNEHKESNTHSCQYRTIRYTYHTIHIVSCVKSSVSYRRIVNAHESYDTVCVLYESYRIVSYDTWTNALK